METEDDMIVLVVVDDDEKAKMENFHKVEDKQVFECSPVESLKVNDIIETAERHGQFVAIKIEPTEDEYDYNEDEMLQRVLETEHADTEYNEHDNSQDDTLDDEDYVPDYDDLVEDEKIDMKQDSRKHRFSMLKPWQQKSFVAELRQEYAELRDDEELLINTLEQIMRSVKPPPPPNDFYIMNGIFFECVYCGTLSETIPSAGRHYQTKHGQRYLVCYACGVDFRSTTNLYKHEKRCVAPDADLVLKARAACIGRKGRSRPYLKLKTYNKSDRARFPCQLCSAVFMTRSNLQSHENLHRGERPFRCHACPCAYTSYSALSRHTKKHMDVQYICDHCSRSFKIKAALVSHMDTHKPIRKYGCAECSRRFAQKSALQLHVNRVHRNLPPPCACHVCPKRYPRMSLLKTHMKRAHGMSIITRKMFFKSLPTMSELEVKQSKVILKTDGDSFEHEPIYQIEDNTFKQAIENYDESSQDIDCVKIAEQLYRQSVEQNIKKEESENNCIQILEQFNEQDQSQNTDFIKIEIPEGSSASIGEFLQCIQRVGSDEGMNNLINYMQRVDDEGNNSSMGEFLQYMHRTSDGANVIYIQNGEVVGQVGDVPENLVLEVEAMVESDRVMLDNLDGEQCDQTIVKTEDLN